MNPAVNQLTLSAGALRNSAHALRDEAEWAAGGHQLHTSGSVTRK
jgi:hypothetical protein